MRWRKIKDNTLFNRLLIRFLLIALIIIVVLGFSMIYFFRSFYFEKRETEIINNNGTMMNLISQSLVEEDRIETFNWLKVVAELNSGQAWIIDEEGYLVSSFPAMADERNRQIKFLEFKEVLDGNIVSSRVESAHFERPMLLVGMPIYYSGNLKGALLLFTSVAGINSTIRQVQRMMLYSSLLAVLLAMIVAYSWSKSLSAPLRKMGEVAIELSQGAFGKTVEVNAEGEVGTLADSMNYLSQRLEETIDDLRKERNKLKYILTGMKEGVLTVNQQQKIILINQSAMKLFDLKDEDGVVDQQLEIIKKDKVEELFRKALQEQESYREELFLGEKNNQKRILIHATPIYIENSQLWGVVGLFQDISQRWRFEQLQKDFVANVSHELKAPLSSIKGSSEILLDGIIPDKEQQQKYLQIILDETNRLTQLVNEILDLAEVDTQVVSFELERVAVKQLLEQIDLVFSKGLKSQEDCLTIIKPEEEVYVLANDEKIKQVLLNLLNNAYKFSGDKSQITLGATRADGNKVKFWVEDEGIGIPQDELENVWERFYKVDKARTPDQGGSGLGLAIVKEIINQHQGETFVESEIGSGSIFGFYLLEDTE
ncbi:cell wall metabolism sensor histidine kinase WalK [Natroniella acetigena]|uniref:HAMP domain-containing sensor histidine kinase n=1 Tax=Natroniella acetigena TaxID=52004 RepID=UPI00200A8992|nr:ATP-binding protein [Natroniella acetigena]MCK8827594.1 cell wall metabolism sensor histidine kinase WalK [Natroniella acetigena]